MKKWNKEICFECKGCDEVIEFLMNLYIEKVIFEEAKIMFKEFFEGYNWNSYADAQSAYELLEKHSKPEVFNELKQKAFKDCFLKFAKEEYQNFDEFLDDIYDFCYQYDIEETEVKQKIKELGINSIEEFITNFEKIINTDVENVIDYLGLCYSIYDDKYEMMQFYREFIIPYVSEYFEKLELDDLIFQTAVEIFSIGEFKEYIADASNCKRLIEGLDEDTINFLAENYNVFETVSKCKKYYKELMK